MKCMAEAIGKEVKVKIFLYEHMKILFINFSALMVVYLVKKSHMLTGRASDKHSDIRASPYRFDSL